MRALAEFIMRGRGQAILVAGLALLLPFVGWIGAAAAALVTLRKGAGEGLQVALWAALGAIAAVALRGDIGPITALLGAVAGALVLRWTVAWPYALLTLALSGVGTALVMFTLGEAYVAGLLALMEQFFEQMRAQMPDPQAFRLQALGPEQISGLLGLRAALGAAAALLLARWWQAALYNPGQFRVEFHALRLPVALALGLVAAALLTASAGLGYRVWALSFAVPLVVAGFALVHGLVGRLGWGRAPLVALYVLWLLLLGPVTIALAVAALIDSAMDFRGRLGRRGQH